MVLSESIWAIDHSHSIYWNKCYKKLAKIKPILYLRPNPLSFARVLIGNDIFNNPLYKSYQNIRGYPSRVVEDTKVDFQKWDLIYFLTSLLTFPYILVYSFYTLILLIVRFLPCWLTQKNRRTIEKSLLRNTIIFDKFPITDCILNQYLRSFYSSGSISNFSLSLIFGLYISSYMVLSRLTSIKLTRKFLNYKAPKYFLINDFGYAEEAIRRLFISWGSLEFTRLYGHSKYSIYNHNSTKEYTPPGINAKFKIHGSPPLLESTHQSDYAEKLISRNLYFGYMNPNVLFKGDQKIYEEIIENLIIELSNTRSICVFMHLHAVSDIQYSIGYDEYIDICDWTYKCLTLLDNPKIKIFLKAHPNIVTPKKKGVNYPADKRFLKTFHKSIGFKNIISKSPLKRSSLHKNLFQINPNIDNLKLLTKLKKIKSLNNCYFATLTHHGTIALESSLINIPSFAATISELLGYQNACYLYKDINNLESQLLERRTSDSEFKKKAKAILNMRYQYVQDYEFAYEKFNEDLFVK